MSQLPEKGDVKAAIDTFEARFDAIGGKGKNFVDAGIIVTDRKTATTGGPGVDTMRRIYGDLFDVGELTAECRDVVTMFMFDIARGSGDPFSSLFSLLMQGVALGVLMERQRWERGDD